VLCTCVHVLGNAVWFGSLTLKACIFCICTPMAQSSSSFRSAFVPDSASPPPAEFCYPPRTPYGVRLNTVRPARRRRSWHRSTDVYMILFPLLCFVLLFIGKQTVHFPSIIFLTFVFWFNSWPSHHRGFRSGLSSFAFAVRSFFLLNCSFCLCDPSFCLAYVHL
jgi:hypothetical protein